MPPVSLIPTHIFLSQLLVEAASPSSRDPRALFLPFRPRERPQPRRHHRHTTPGRSFHTDHTRRSRDEAPQQPPAYPEPIKKPKPQHFSYGLAAAYCGKAHRFNPNEHYFSYDGPTLQKFVGGKPVTPSTSKGRIPSGQDACFVSEIGGTGAVAFGVADGVGGWIEQKIDSADFAHGLCNSMAEACRRHPASDKPLRWSGTSPKELLGAGYDLVCANENIKGGGSTACLGIADRDGNLKTANLGDSGYIHIRLNKVMHVSEHQTHAFNTPYQMSRIPARVFLQVQRFGGQTPISDTPRDAATSHHALRHGEVVILATDGVWDNLSSQDLLELVCDRMAATGAWTRESSNGGSSSGAMRVGSRLHELTREPSSRKDGDGKSIQSGIATAVVEKAKAASINPRRESPFSRAVERQFPGENYRGGKVDDICVVVVVAVEQQQQPPAQPKPKM